MVYRTGNRKQLERKLFGKEVSFEAVQKTVSIAAEVTLGG